MSKPEWTKQGVKAVLEDGDTVLLINMPRSADNGVYVFHGETMTFHRPTVIERVDKYNVTINGRMTVRADERQEELLRLMSPDELARFLRVMGAGDE